MIRSTKRFVVLGLGAEVNFFGTAGAAEHAFPMYTLADAVRLKEPVLETWEAADKEPGLAEGRPPRVHLGGLKQAHGRSDHWRSGRLDLSYPRHAQVGHRVEAHTLVWGGAGLQRLSTSSVTRARLGARE